MRTLLQGLAAEGRTVLVSSHLLSEMQALADDIVIVAAGKLVQQGPVSEVVSTVPTGRERVYAVTPEPDLLAETLRRHGATVSDTGPQSLVVTGLPAAGVGDAALAAGVALHGLRTEQADLEDVFLELTHAKAGIR